MQTEYKLYGGPEHGRIYSFPNGPGSQVLVCASLNQTSYTSYIKGGIISDEPLMATHNYRLESMYQDGEKVWIYVHEG